MDVVVVYESLFGNTRQIAEAIAAGVRQTDPVARVTVVPVAQATADLLSGAGMVIAGAPTHIFGMTRPSSRRQGLTGAVSAMVGQSHPEIEPGASGPGIREWLAGLTASPHGTLAAAFDTRLSFPLSGGAAGPIARGLRRHGYRVFAKPVGFIVSGSYGPSAPANRTGRRPGPHTWRDNLSKPRPDVMPTLDQRRLTSPWTTNHKPAKCGTVLTRIPRTGTADDR
jgi:hypothetical protein